MKNIRFNILKTLIENKKSYRIYARNNKLSLFLVIRHFSFWGERISEQEIIKNIEEHNIKYYTIDPETKERVYVEIVGEHIRTMKNGKITDNLENLPIII